MAKYISFSYRKLNLFVDKFPLSRYLRKLI